MCWNETVHTGCEYSHCSCNIFKMIQAILDAPVPYTKEIWQACQYYAINCFPILPPFTSTMFWTCFIVSCIIPMIFYHIGGFLFYLIDMYSSETFKLNHKVQNNIRVTSSQYANALYVSLRNWILIGFPYLAVISKINERSFSETELNSNFPTIGVLLRDLVVFAAVEEILFYSFHRVLHRGAFYATIHKVHHSFTAPCAISAIYAHPVEHLFSNVMPVSLGPLLMRSHPISSMIWGIVVLYSTMFVHSGYDFSQYNKFLFPSPYFHDWHHEKFNENFGATETLDYLFRTSKNYLEAIAKGEMHVPRKSNQKISKSN
jgi:sterol desaturase/sphingolipid hydroxylase (fatty acid hydroxylase superfamily)